jgi:hydrogenase-1 operon protein HyaF
MTTQLLAQDLPEVWHLLSPTQRHEAIDWLGVGEVTVQVGDQVIVETRLPGIWLSTEGLVVGEFPTSALAALAAAPLTEAHLPLELGVGTMSAEPLLAEVRSHAEALKAALAAVDDYRELIDLSRLPVNRADIEYLSAALGQGPVTAVVATDGECRLRSTLVAGVWWVVYFDSEERELLTTLEIAQVPAIASATAAELAASLAELADYLGANDA